MLIASSCGGKSDGRLADGEDGSLAKVIERGGKRGCHKAQQCGTRANNQVVEGNCTKGRPLIRRTRTVVQMSDFASRRSPCILALEMSAHRTAMPF